MRRPGRVQYSGPGFSVRDHLGKGPEWEEVYADMPLGTASWPQDLVAMEVQGEMGTKGLDGACRCSAEPEEGTRVPLSPSGCPFTPPSGAHAGIGRCAGVGRQPCGAGAVVYASLPGLWLTFHKPPPRGP